MIVKANNLIVLSRLDICSKIPLVRAWESGVDERWGRELYFAYLSRIKPSNGFNQDSDKTSLEDYYLSFRALYESMKNSGFLSHYGLIPVHGNSPTNGAHRIAIASVLGLDIETEQTNESPHIYDYKFMRTIGLSETFSDALMNEFLLINSNLRVFCLMGIPKNSQLEIQEFINMRRKICFKKVIELTEIGKRRMMEVLYGFHDWWDQELLETLSLERFNYNDHSITLIYIEAGTLEDDMQLKADIRNMFMLGTLHKKVHSTDNKCDLLRLSRIALNQNSIHFLNTSPIGAETNIIEKCKQMRILKGLDLDDIAIDGSATLEMYGLRKARDIDVVAKGDVWSMKQDKSFHNYDYENNFLKPNDIVMDPRCHFLWDEFKFISLPSLLSYKAFRGEEKDWKDLALVQSAYGGMKLYADIGHEHRAKVFRIMLFLRNKTEVILSVFPSPLASIVRKTYKKIRICYRSLRSG